MIKNTKIVCNLFYEGFHIYENLNILIKFSSLFEFCHKPF